MTREVWAVELRLVKLTADLDESGAVIGGGGYRRECYLSHWTGSLPDEQEARSVYRVADEALTREVDAVRAAERAWAEARRRG